jgi:type IV pilus assembly protein PilY1
MNTNRTPLAWTRATWRGLAPMLMLLAAGPAAAQLVSQNPLSAGGNVPGNMVLTPSVEFPTINSKANLNTPPTSLHTFVAGSTYVGYFDPLKCYKYSYNATESLRHFYPVSSQLVPAICAGASQEWSGNFLNWAATQTIDPFRKALTGGLRARDTASETWLEKARHDGQGGLGYFPVTAVTGSGTIGRAMPSTVWTTVSTRVVGAGNQLLFTSSGTGTGAAQISVDPGLPTTITIYDPSTHTLNNTGSNPSRIYSVSVRVKVCDSTIGLEPNCNPYGGYNKPEGLIQKYQEKLRFSVFGYLLDNGAYRDGGVLRANQKFVGARFLNKLTNGWEPNTIGREIAADGTFVQNPDSAAAAATTTIVGGGSTIQYSGVINYINMFGQLTGTNSKNFDPVSELYYTATRYLRNLAPVPTYSDLTRQYSTAAGSPVAAGVGRFNLTDGFPVIDAWNDPYEYWCQSSAIIGIGDVYTHKDKNLTGHGADSAYNTSEPTVPALVSTDPSFTGTGNHSIPWWTRKAYTNEGLAYPMPLDSGLNSSAYMVGLAYYTHTQDLRLEAAMPGSQTISTHWVDVREVQRIEAPHRNQYWMAAKYGGFTTPPAAANYDATIDARNDLLDAWWSTPGDTLTSNGVAPNSTFLRASNYYVADKPDTMVSGLNRAFAKAVTERKGSGVGLAANSTRLDTETRAFQAQFSNGSWLGQLSAYDFVTTGPVVGISALPLWNAGEKMPLWSARNIYVNGTSYSTFSWGNLTAAQQTSLNSLSTVLAPATGSDVVEYIQGNRAREEFFGGSLRTRTVPSATWSPILGDIVNSTPVFVGRPRADLYSASPGTWRGKSAYAAFATSAVVANRIPTLWVGANDGMMHAFNATTGDLLLSGKEIYAFIPKASFDGGLVNVANPDYEHRYFVDGDSAVADVWTTTTAPAGYWRTVLVGTMGRGRPGVFALDITNPAAVQFLWEKNATDIPALGHNIGKPVIAQVADGDWRVLFGNGPDSATGAAQLITIDVSTGAVHVVNAGNAGANGMSAVHARDTNANGLADTIYSGDLLGNVYKITNFQSGTATVLTLFTAALPSTVRQPIMVAPLVGRDPATGYRWVFFGTGKYLTETDQTNSAVQSWYGFRDDNALVLRSELEQRSASLGGDTSGAFITRTIEEATAGDLTGKKGWYIDLPATRERMVVPNQFSGMNQDVLLGLTRIPDSSDVCLPTGRSFLMGINAYTGGRLEQTLFDTNNDGEFDDDDRVDDEDGVGDETSGGDGDGEEEDPSGLGFNPGGSGMRQVGDLVCVTLDDGTVKCQKIRGSSVQARRGSWREISN